MPDTCDVLNDWRSRDRFTTLLNRISLTVHLLAIGQAGGDADDAVASLDEVIAAAEEAITLLGG